MIAQNIQSYRKETRNTDTSLCSCTRRAVTPGPGTKGTRANSVLESASYRPPGHQFTVNIKPLQRCCFHMGHRSHRATRPVSSGDKFWAPWRQDSNPSSLGGILQAPTADQGVSPSTSRATAPCQPAKNPAFESTEEQFCWREQS